MPTDNMETLIRAALAESAGIQLAHEVCAGHSFQKRTEPGDTSAADAELRFRHLERRLVLSASRALRDSVAKLRADSAPDDVIEAHSRCFFAGLNDEAYGTLSETFFAELRNAVADCTNISEVA
jgi:hypothetical protein